MKKMMIIAVLIGGMLMPAQIMAKNNNGNNKPKVEYNKKFDNKKPQGKFDNKKGFKKGYDKKAVYKYNNKYDKKYGNKFYKKPNKKYCKKYKKNKPNVVVVNKPAPMPVPPPPAPVKVVYKSDPISAVASVVGLAALAAIIAN